MGKLEILGYVKEELYFSNSVTTSLDDEYQSYHYFGVFYIAV